MYFLLFAIFALCVVIFLKQKVEAGHAATEMRSQMNALHEVIHQLQQRVDAIADRVLLNRGQRRAKWWYEMPEPEIERFRMLAEGSEQELIMIDGYGDEAEVAGIHYTHERLEFRTDGEKDAVAHGKARPWATINDVPVKIYINQKALTAKIVGMPTDGRVKFAGYRARIPD